MRKETAKTIELMRHLSNRKQYVLDTLQSIENHENTFDMIKKKEKEKSPLSWAQRIILRLTINKFIKKFEKMEGSWKTSLMGWIVLIGVFATSVKNLLDGDPSTVFDMNALIEALKAVGIGIPLGIGLLFARDKNVSSEEQRAASKK